MHLPENVRRVVDEFAGKIPFARLKSAAREISEAYRNGRPLRLNTPERTAAYLVTRMPATYAAANRVLAELRPVKGLIGSVLDVGAGTGAASLAAAQLFPGASITMLERERRLSEIGRGYLPDPAVIAADIVVTENLPRHDLVIAAYSLGEFGESLAARLWNAARIALVVIEPGTPRGFATIRKVRNHLLAAGARMAAPCPMESACPIVEPDWCHFAARVERSSMHRRLKEGDLGYEDEKFSYVVLAREEVARAAARIVRRPHYDPGLIELATCTPRGIETRRVPKSDREPFHAARKADWGDVWRY